MPEGLPHAAGTVHHANQPEHFAAALQGGAFEFSAKPGAGFVATLRLFQLGGFFIQHARIGPHQSRSALLPGLSTLLVPLRIGAIPPEVNGRAAAAADLLLVAGGAEFGCSASAPLEWAAVVLPPSLLRHWQEAFSVPARAAGGVRRLAPARQAAHHLAGALSYAIHLAEDLPEFLLPTQANEAIGTALGEALADCMASACLPGLAHPRAGRDAWRVTNGVDAVLASHLDQPIYTGQLCDALGISARKLHYSLIATVGMSPHEYLKARRLALVRRALLQPDDAGARRIKTIALRHGFLHMGNFAKDYHRMFGETPSATFASARR